MKQQLPKVSQFKPYSEDSLHDDANQYHKAQVLRIVAILLGQRGDDAADTGNVPLTTQNVDKNKKDDDLSFLDDIDDESKVINWADNLRKFCLGRYCEDFLHEFGDIVWTNANQFKLNRLQNFERKYIGKAATLKHPKYEQFVQKCTKFKNYQSVFSNKPPQIHVCYSTTKKI